MSRDWEHEKSFHFIRNGSSFHPLALRQDYSERDTDLKGKIEGEVINPSPRGKKNNVWKYLAGVGSSPWTKWSCFSPQGHVKMTPGVSKTPESLHHPQVKAQEVQGSDLPRRTALGVGMGVRGQGQDLQACPNSESLRASKIFEAIWLQWSLCKPW